MAYQDLALPVDIPWKRLAASSDMMDNQHGDRKYPPKWRSSISIFYHEPTELPETYCDRKVTYLKIVCSITGYQASEAGDQPGPEIGISTPPEADTWTWERLAMGAAYHPCCGALLQVAVFPKTADGETVPLSDYPYIADFEPKRRELYEAVTRSGEILGRSASTLNLRKSATSGETTEISSKVGAEVKGSYTWSPGTSVEGKITGEHSWGGGTHVQEENVRTTDESREKRETYSATTSLTQMYELFTGYHLGGNRAVFFIISRPHITDQKDLYTFVNGPRKLEGVQEVFLVINRPKNIPGLCVEAYLETGHRFAPKIEDIPNVNPVTSKPESKNVPLPPLSKNLMGKWNDTEAKKLGNKQEFDLLVGHSPPGALIDTNQGGGSFDVEWIIKHHLLICATSDPKKHDFAKKPINIPKGYEFKGAAHGPTMLWNSLDDITFYQSGDEVRVRVTLHDTPHAGDPRFQGEFLVYLYRVETVTPASPSTPTPAPSPSAVDKPLFLTGRALSACLTLTEQEATDSAQIYKSVNWSKVLDPNHQAELIDWLDQHRVLDLKNVRLEDYREKLIDLIERDKPEFEQRVRDTFDRGNIDLLPNEWLLPSEWISFETELTEPAWLSNPEVPAQDRIRASNNLTDRIARTMIESLGSVERYPNGAVSFFETRMALEHLAEAFAKMPDEHPDNMLVSELPLDNREEILARFDDNIRRKDLITMPLEQLRRELNLSEMSARQLKLNLIRASEQLTESPLPKEKGYFRHNG